MPSPSPALPQVRAKIRSCCASAFPVFQVFSPLITHSSPSRTAVVSMWVASEPCSGSVMPNAKPLGPRQSSSTPPSVPRCRNGASAADRRCCPRSTCSFCRSLCRPRPLRRGARGSRPCRGWCRPGRRTPPGTGSGSGRRRRRGGAPRRAAPPTRSFGRPPRSQSVRASSRRWSKNRMLSSCSSSGLISRSMNRPARRGSRRGPREVEVHGVPFARSASCRDAGSAAGWVVTR